MSFIRRIFGIEKRATLREPPSWLSAAMIGSEPTASGVTVSPESALSLATYFACIRNLAEDVGKLPLLLYRRLKPKGKARAVAHPLFALLRDAPNPEMSSQCFREVMMVHALTRGNGFAEITRDARGRPAGLWILDPTRVNVERKGTGPLVYVVRPQMGGKEITLAAENVFHIKGVSADGIVGMSIAHHARQSLGLGLALDHFGATFFGNGATIGTVFKFPHALSPKAREDFRDMLREQREGLANAHKSLILEHGGDVSRTSIPPDDAQFLESMRFSVETIARWFRMPQHKIGMLDKATYSNISELERVYVSDTVLPWARRFESEVQRKLLPVKTDLFAEHLLEGVLRGDTGTRYQRYEIALRNGWMNRNEVRELENLNPFEGGDTFQTGEPSTNTSKPPLKGK